jgi:hypothetical protein
MILFVRDIIGGIERNGVIIFTGEPMNFKDRWQSQPYWIRGSVFGFSTAVIVTETVILGFHTKCMEVPSCADYAAFFWKVFIVFGPVGTLAGAVIGFIIDKIRK